MEEKQANKKYGRNKPAARVLKGFTSKSTDEFPSLSALEKPKRIEQAEAL